LFFDGGDILAVHTLTAAAFQVFSGVGKTKGIVRRYRSEELIRPERMNAGSTALTATPNFLKHADKDPHAAHDYAEESTILLLYEAVELAQRVFPKDLNSGRERAVLKAWFTASFPELIIPEMLERLRAMNPTAVSTTDKALWAEYLNKPEHRHVPTS